MEHINNYIESMENNHQLKYFLDAMEANMNWWNITMFGLIPVLSVAIIFCFKKKFLWVAPLVSTVLSIIVSIVAMPSILNDNEHRAIFFGISILIHLAVVIGLTVISYIVSFVHKRKK